MKKKLLNFTLINLILFITKVFCTKETDANTSGIFGDIDENIKWLDENIKLLKDEVADEEVEEADKEADEESIKTAESLRADLIEFREEISKYAKESPNTDYNKIAEWLSGTESVEKPSALRPIQIVILKMIGIEVIMFKLLKYRPEGEKNKPLQDFITEFENHYYSILKPLLLEETIMENDLMKDVNWIEVQKKLMNIGAKIEAKEKEAKVAKKLVETKDANKKAQKDIKKSIKKTQQKVVDGKNKKFEIARKENQKTSGWSNKWIELMPLNMRLLYNKGLLKAKLRIHSGQKEKIQIAKKAEDDLKEAQKEADKFDKAVHAPFEHEMQILKDYKTSYELVKKFVDEVEKYLKKMVEFIKDSIKHS